MKVAIICYELLCVFCFLFVAVTMAFTYFARCSAASLWITSVETLPGKRTEHYDGSVNQSNTYRGVSIAPSITSPPTLLTNCGRFNFCVDWFYVNVHVNASNLSHKSEKDETSFSHQCFMLFLSCKSLSIFYPTACPVHGPV